jgi:hypothetical protein
MTVVFVVTAERTSNYKLHNLLVFQYTATHGVGPIHKIVQYKFLWLRLSYLTQELGNSMGFSYGSFVVLCFSAQVLSSYGSLLGIHQGVKLIHTLLIFASLFIALILYCICTAAQNATQEVQKLLTKFIFLSSSSSSMSFKSPNRYNFLPTGVYTV